MKVGSVFSGVGGIDLAFERAGAQVIWNCEIDMKCRSVLQKHWSGIPMFKDVKTVTGKGLGTAGLVPDALVGGFPCTDVSVAGKRAGLAGEQSGLFFEFARLLDEVRPAWTLIENVPGLLSSHAGADMGTVVGHLVDLGYGVAWRVLDAQYFGVAQRRRRVFIVGCLGDRARAAEVLLEPEGGGGDPPARTPAGERVAGSLTSCAGDGGYGGVGQSASSITSRVVETRGPIAGNGDIVQGLTGSFGNGGADDNKAQAGWLVPAVSNALCSNRGQRNDHNEQTFLPVAFHMTQDPITGDISPAIDGVKPTTGYPTIAVQQELAVRRLLPVECLRLQGFPDDWLDGLKLADSVKYRMAGNAVAVPVVTWIAQRMIKFDEQP